MEIPNLPTDNLYKFMALSGVIIVLVANYFIITNSVKHYNEAYALTSEINLLEHDTTALKLLNTDVIQKQYVITQYISEKYKIQLPLSCKGDTLLSLYTLYSMALRDNRLMSIYEKLESAFETTEKQAYEFERERIKIKSLNDTLQRKSKDAFVLLISQVIFDLIGGFFAFRGFKLWYSRVQIYQDEALKKQSMKDIK